MGKYIFFILNFFIYLVTLNSSYSSNNEFSSQDAWREMTHHAQNRVNWFNETIKELKDPTIPLNERLKQANKINPWLKDSLSQLPQSKNKTIPQTSLLNKVIDDLNYCSLYWNVLKKSLVFYNTSPNNTNEAVKKIVPHIANELINFDVFALGDLITCSNCQYYAREVWINREIFKYCQKIADCYHVKINQMMLIKDDTKNKDDENSVESKIEKTITNNNFKATGAFRQPSKDSLLLMEQIIYYRRNVAIQSFTNDPIVKRLENYILPTTGPMLFADILEQSVQIISTETPSSKKARKQKRKNNRKKNSAANAKNLSSITNHLDQSNNESVTCITHNEKQEIEYLDLSKVENNSTTSSIQNRTSELNQIPENKVLSYADILKNKNDSEKFNLQDDKKVFVNKYVLKEITLQDVVYKVRKTSDFSYFLNGQKHFFPDFNPFGEDFLIKIKKMTRLSPRTDKLPNIAQGLITFYCKDQDKSFSKRLILQEKFLSGGKFFAKQDITFKNQHKIINTLHDMLLPEDRYIFNLENYKKRIPLEIAMEKRLRNEIIKGTWTYNGLDSEAIFLLFLTQKLPGMINNELLKDSKSSITIEYAVLDILSYYNCCDNCQRLIQGFQNRLRDIILSFNLPNLVISETFGTLAFVKGQILPNYKYKEYFSTVQKDKIELNNQHSLFCYENGQT